MISQIRDIKSGVIVITAGITLVAMVGFVFKHFFRNFTFRKDSSVPIYEGFGASAKLTGVAATDTSASAPMVAPLPRPEPQTTNNSENITPYETSPIDPLEVAPFMLASEEVLRRDWDSPEEDEAWAHL